MFTLANRELMLHTCVEGQQAVSACAARAGPGGLFTALLLSVPAAPGAALYEELCKESTEPPAAGTHRDTRGAVPPPAPTLQVTTAPTPGSSCASASRTTDTTGSCEAHTRAQLGAAHACPASSGAPLRAHPAALGTFLQAAGQRGEDGAVPRVGPAARRGLLRAAQPLACGTLTQRRGRPARPPPAARPRTHRARSTEPAAPCSVSRSNPAKSPPPIGSQRQGHAISGVTIGSPLSPGRRGGAPPAGSRSVAPGDGASRHARCAGAGRRALPGAVRTAWAPGMAAGGRWAWARGRAGCRGAGCRRAGELGPQRRAGEAAARPRGGAGPAAWCCLPTVGPRCPFATAVRHGRGHL